MFRVILLVHSTKDIAGVNIAKSLHERLSFKDTDKTYEDSPVYEIEIQGKRVLHVTLKEESVRAQNLAVDFPDAELAVFVSRHSSQSGKPTLSVHTPGNLGDAEMGGFPRQISVSPAVAMQTALKALSHMRNEKNLGYDVSYEGTHHGPSLPVPTMFVELGSSEVQWRDEAAAEVVGQAAIEAIAGFEKADGAAVLGVGGTHYNEKFTKMALDGQAAFGHMIPKYAIPHMDANMLRQCVERTYERVDRAVLDWKGIRGEEKPALTALFDEIGLKTEKV